jgi:iron(III) transport system ATP-binding protein
MTARPPEGTPARAPVRGRAAAVFAASLGFEGVERQFEDRMALAGVTLAIDPGEIVCLLGPSGSGKTTLLRIASGIEKPSAGRVVIDGAEVAGPKAFVPPEDRGVGLMFQDFALFPHLSIAHNVSFGLRRLSQQEKRREALGMLERVGLAHLADAYPATLSGGEQQRVALARAILPRPRVMLMDEPFSGLDVQLREQLQGETLKLLAETRATCLMVTHSPDEAMRIADRIAVMRDGRLVQVGRAEDLYRNPADLFVARLFSEINEIAMTVTGGVLKTPIGTFAIPDLVEGEAARLCIRRSAIRLTASGTGLSGRVLRRRFLGDMMRLELAVEGFDQPLAMHVPEDQAPPLADDVTVVIDPAGVLVFPAGLRDQEA